MRDDYEEEHGIEKVQYVDAHSDEGYGKFKTDEDIIREQIAKVMRYGSMELRGGYFNTIFKNNQEIKKYVPDSRVQFINAVAMLNSILIPKKEESEAFKKYESDFKGVLKDIKGTKDTTELLSLYNKLFNLQLRIYTGAVGELKDQERQRVD